MIYIIQLLIYIMISVMFNKIFKIIFWSWKKYFIYVFLSVFLSLFSYLLSTNILLSVGDYIKDQIKPIVWWDIVLSSSSKNLDLSYFKDYSNDFDIAKSISINSSIFDIWGEPTLVNLVYYSDLYPFYNDFSYQTINNSWTLIVDKKTFDNFWNALEILWKTYYVKWILTKWPISNLSIYASNNDIYLPILNFDNSLNPQNSRINYKYYFKLKSTNSSLISYMENNPDFSWFSITTPTQRNQNISNITDRFYVFVNFFNLTIFILAFFIVILSLESYFKKIKSDIWLLNIFWLKLSQIFFYNFIALLWIFVFSFIVAFILNFAFIFILSKFYSFFWVYILSFYKWFFVSLILLLVWIFLPFYKLSRQKTLQIIALNWDFVNFKKWDYFIYLTLIFIWFYLISFLSNISLLNSFYYSILFVFWIIFSYIIINFVLNQVYKILKKFRFVKSNFYLSDSLRSTIKPWNLSFLVIFSSLISFVSIFIFFVFSWSFLNFLQNLSWSTRDMYILNVQSSDLEVAWKYFSKDEIFEIVSLKIDEVNKMKLAKFLWVSQVPLEFSREFFSTTNVLDNKIISWMPLTSWWVSVDKEFWDSLWLKLWDKITFTVAWLRKTLVVQNFREAVRNWTNPFFYFNLNPDDFLKFPKSYIISYKQSQKINGLESILHKEINSNLTFVNTKEIIDLVVWIAQKILLVVYLCLGYILIFSFLSFLVCIMFLSTFKTSKLKLLNILWWNLEKLWFYLNLEYSYLVLIWLFLSIFLWILALIFIFYFIKYFSLYIAFIFIWILILITLFLIFIWYLFIKKSPKN